MLQLMNILKQENYVGKLKLLTSLNVFTPKQICNKGYNYVVKHIAHNPGLYYNTWLELEGT